MSTIEHNQLLSDRATSEFAALIARHSGIVRKVAAIYSPTREDGADLAQDILVQLLASRKSYDSSRPISTWMYRIALNVAISQVRRRYHSNRLMVPLDDGHAEIPATEVDHEQREHRALLDRAMQSLDPLNRAVLLLYLDGFSQSEIADVVGVSPSNVGTKIARIKQRLRLELGIGQLEGDIP